MAEEAPKTTPPHATEATPDAPTAAETTPDAPTAAETAPAEAEGEHKPQPADLMTSARTLAEAAQAAAAQQTDKIDKAKVAEAAENVLEAAKSTGKLDDKGGVGQYLHKAQDYLHQMHSGDTGKEETDEDKDKEKEKEKEKESGGGSAAGGFMKMAQGFFK